MEKKDLLQFELSKRKNLQVIRVFSLKRFKVWHIRKPTAPLSSSASYKRTRPKAMTPQKDDSPAILNSCLYEADKKFQTKQETDELRRSMGPAWLGLHKYLCKEIPCITRLTLVREISTRKGSHKIHVLMRIFPTKKELFHQETEVSSTLL